MTSHDRSTTWFLAQLKPNIAAIAERNLKRQGFRTFLPLEEHSRRRYGKFATVLRPLFPGYIFVAFNTANGDWRAINATLGISRLVSFGSDPAPVPSNVITQLMLRCDRSGKLLPPKLLQPGDQVTLTKGPLANFVAEVETIAADRRVWLLMEIMGAQTRVAVGASQVRAV